MQDYEKKILSLTMKTHIGHPGIWITLKSSKTFRSSWETFVKGMATWDATVLEKDSENVIINGQCQRNPWLRCQVILQ